MTGDEAKAYLNGLSFHRGRTGDTAFMNPDFAIKLATAIQTARAHGLQVGLLSGYREAADHPSSYDEKGWSSHEYGIAADVSGIGAPGSSTAAQWRQIATAAGLYSPYDPNGGEWNHWQLNPVPLEQAPPLLNALVAAKKTGDPTKMWAAFTPTTGGPGSVVNAGTAGPIAAGPDNRATFFNAAGQSGHDASTGARSPVEHGRREPPEHRHVGLQRQRSRRRYRRSPVDERTSPRAGAVRGLGGQAGHRSADTSRLHRRRVDGAGPRSQVCPRPARCLGRDHPSEDPGRSVPCLDDDDGAAGERGRQSRRANSERSGGWFDRRQRELRSGHRQGCVTPRRGCGRGGSGRRSRRPGAAQRHGADRLGPEHGFERPHR